jgi:hypothetical protein
MNDLPYVLYLPSDAAVAWHHKRLGGEVQADFGRTLAEVKEVAIGEYVESLALGQGLGVERRKKVAEKISRYTI